MYGTRRMPPGWGAFRVAGVSIVRGILPADRVAASTTVRYGSFGVGGSLRLPIAALVAENHDWDVLGRRHRPVRNGRDQPGPGVPVADSGGQRPRTRRVTGRHRPVMGHAGSDTDGGFPAVRRRYAAALERPGHRPGDRWMPQSSGLRVLHPPPTVGRRLPRKHSRRQARPRESQPPAPSRGHGAAALVPALSHTPPSSTLSASQRRSLSKTPGGNT